MSSQSDNNKKVYFLGVGGIAMGTLATMLKERGFDVSGSDQNLYPPMSLHLEALRIPLHQGYRAENLERRLPDVVVVGNVIRRDNPEAQYVLEHNIPYVSMPEAISRFFLEDHKSMVVAGTHGKSTTSALLAWVLAHGGMDPSAFIGAFLKNWQRSYRLGNGPYMVLEGDEYDTAFFDKGPKFLHYRPHIGVITSIEFDHADIFKDFDAVLKAFRDFVKIIPSDGYLLVNADDPNCLAVAKECKGKVITYACRSDADWQLLDVVYRSGEVEFAYKDPQQRKNTMISKLAGRHNLSNSLAVLAAASIAGLTGEQVQEALLAFQGVKRRQDVIGEGRGVLVIDDFAHHPTAVKETIQALRLYYPERRLIAAFEPRTNSSRRNVFENDYALAFDLADRVCIKQPPDIEKIPEEERLDVAGLVRKISRRHADASLFENTEALLQSLLQRCEAGDLVLCMSNGSFDGLPQRLFKALREEEGRGGEL
jgi:UDP-N-acetylmuramate: L-alanyl-gamma-D-glutamyl-meso-diaminopimelate ligase